MADPTTTPTPAATPAPAPSNQPTGQTPTAPAATDNSNTSTVTPSVDAGTPAVDSNDVVNDALFKELFIDGDVYGDEPTETPKAEVKPAAQPQKPKPAETPAAVPKKPDAAQVPEPPKAPEPAKPAEVAATQPVQPKAPTDDERKATYTKWRGDSEKRLEQLYQLSPEDGEAMLAKPEATLPKLAARLHMDVYEAVVGEMQQHLPRIFSHLMETQQRVKESEDSFFGQFPKLSAHKDKVFNFMQAFRQSNPTMPRDEFASQVGLAMMAALKLQPDAPSVTQSAPKAPEIVRREVVDPVTGFVPAPVSGVAPAPMVTAPTNPYAALAEEMLKDG